ncbi:hypothetical protein NDU88_003327 [Pleurodeles waltl]|uniref:Uncharacterized protein n=1 Tax=Pleurodeles waltl TaxID=8319 RepID=A0AAV7UDE0_PLEWA|nr:hypothetical protein NDU88_003327 [Pleurodeles waltl]
MATHHSKKDTSIKDMLSKPQAKKSDQLPDTQTPSSPQESDVDSGALASEEAVARTFLEKLFGALRYNIAALRRDVAADVRGLQKEIGEVGQCLDMLEQSNNHKEEEVMTIGGS